jgi:hypothetical protein
MVEEGIREAAAMAEVPCEVVRPLLLGVEVALSGHGRGRFLTI